MGVKARTRPSDVARRRRLFTLLLSSSLTSPWIVLSSTTPTDFHPSSLAPVPNSPPSFSPSRPSLQNPTQAKPPSSQPRRAPNRLPPPSRPPPPPRRRQSRSRFLRARRRVSSRVSLAGVGSEAGEVGVDVSFPFFLIRKKTRQRKADFLCWLGVGNVQRKEWVSEDESGLLVEEASEEAEAASSSPDSQARDLPLLLPPLLVLPTARRTSLPRRVRRRRMRRSSLLRGQSGPTSLRRPRSSRVPPPPPLPLPSRTRRQRTRRRLLSLPLRQRSRTARRR